MTVFNRGVSVCIVLAAAAVGLADPASAEPPTGSYTATMVDDGGVLEPGPPGTWNLTSCAANCVRVKAENESLPSDLYLQGNSWSGVDGDDHKCTDIMDSSSLSYVIQCPGQRNIVFQLTKNG